jgi:hypothetical protein
MQNLFLWQHLKTDGVVPLCFFQNRLTQHLVKNYKEVLNQYSSNQQSEYDTEDHHGHVYSNLNAPGSSTIAYKAHKFSNRTKNNK